LCAGTCTFCSSRCARSPPTLCRRCSRPSSRTSSPSRRAHAAELRTMPRTPPPAPHPTTGAPHAQRRAGRQEMSAALGTLGLLKAVARVPFRPPPPPPPRGCAPWCGGWTRARGRLSGGMDETCPVSTGGWTRRVQSVREGGGGGRGAARRAAWARTSALVVQSCAYCRRVENLLAPPPGSVSQNAQAPGAWRGGLVARGGGGWYRPWSQTPSGKTFVRETVGGRRSQTPASAPDTCGPRVVQI